MKKEKPGTHDMESLKPIEGAKHSIRKRLTLKDELVLATLPTTVILIVFILVETLSNQRLLFASLASSAFLIYLDPQHGTNRVKTLILSQMIAAVTGMAAYSLIGPTYISGAVAMVFVIAFMILADAMHPPAVSTALSFALRAGNESNLMLFGLAVGITAILVLLSRFSIWFLSRK